MPLQKGMYGTRDVAANFAAMVTGMLRGMDFAIVVFNPCLFRRATRGPMLIFQGGDFDHPRRWRRPGVLGEEAQRGADPKIRGALGPEDSDMMGAMLLNRIARYGNLANGQPFLEWQPDARYAENITETLGLMRAANAKELSSPGITRNLGEANRGADLRDDSRFGAVRQDFMFTMQEIAWPVAWRRRAAWLGKWRSDAGPSLGSDLILPPKKHLSSPQK